MGVIYESRPNVTIDASCLCLKSNNALILRGGSDSFHTSFELVKIIKKAKRYLFKDPIDCLITIALLSAIILASINIFKWLITVADWSVITGNIGLYIYGSYPQLEEWRATKEGISSHKYKDAGLLAPIIYENNKYSVFNSLDLSLGKNGELIKITKSKKRNIIPSGDFCVEAVSATTMLLKKSILNKIGGWDENIYTYLEDLDLCLKLRRNNFQIVKINNSKVNHIGFGSHKHENISKFELSRNWHFMWSSLYFKQKYENKNEFISYFLRNFIKYFFKTILFALILKKKKTILNFMRFRACINYLIIKKSNFRINLIK